jgi:RimJ/RimL family protein N-acetyltransferase
MVILVRATMDDAARLFEWRTDPATRENSHEDAPVSFEHHCAWLEQILRRQSVRLYIVHDPQRGEHIGTCRLDREGGSARISLTVSPQERGRGYAAQILGALRLEALAWGIDTLTASVKASNTVSRRAFVAAKFHERHDGGRDEIIEFELMIGEDARQPRVKPA